VVYAGAASRGPASRIAAFLEAVTTELHLRADGLDARFGSRPPLGSLYLGGGTPSLLPGAAVAELVALVRDRFGLAAGAEVSLEANPGTEDRGDVAAFAAAGVTRISFGVQSLAADELQRLGRRHRPEEVADAVDAARAAGIRSVNLDLLYDIPDSSLDTWASTLDAALALRPDHLSLYALALDDPDAEGLTGPGGDHLAVRPGARRWRARARKGQDEDRAAAQYRHAVDRLAGEGWHGYEISNWARPGHESRHNLAYWKRRPCEALGPGAHAFDGATRRWNAASLDGYLTSLAPPTGEPPCLPPGGAETLDAATAHTERVILGLRLDRGLPLGAAAVPPLADAFDWAITSELLDVTLDDRIVLTTRGRLLSNELFSRLV
jgi:coproporphyrinogen III oxidase-like Fe-S oxidoreductase